MSHFRQCPRPHPHPEQLDLVGGLPVHGDMELDVLWGPSNPNHSMISLTPFLDFAHLTD